MLFNVDSHDWVSWTNVDDFFNGRRFKIVARRKWSLINTNWRIFFVHDDFIGLMHWIIQQKGRALDAVMTLGNSTKKGGTGCYDDTGSFNKKEGHWML